MPQFAPGFDPADCCRPAVLGVEPYRPGKSAADLAHEYGVADMIKLASNENMLGPPPGAVAAVAGCGADLGLYPDGGGRKLKQALAARHDVAPECITLGNGSNELLELVGRCFLGAGKNAVYSRHAFAVYALTTQICGADGRVAPARAAADAMPYGDDLDAMAAAIDAATRVVFLANPNNPTGTWNGAAALAGFLRKVPASAVAVVDEAYAEYVTQPDYPVAAAWLGRFPNLVVTRTFSKAFGLAGLRVGYALSSPAVAELMDRVRQPFNVGVPAQRGALAALADRGHIEKSVATNRAGLAQLQAGCDRLGLPWLPSAANFLCIEAGDDALGIYHRLIGRGVIVRPVDNYGLPRHLRVTVGLPEHNRRFLEALEQVLER